MKTEIKQQIRKSKNILWAARIWDLFTATSGVSLSIPSLGSSLILAEIVDSIPEILLTTHRGYQQRQFLKELLPKIQEENGLNSPKELLTLDFLRESHWKDTIIHRIIPASKTESDTLFINKYKDIVQESNKNIIDKGIASFLRGTWKEILDLIPIVNRISMEEKKYIKLLKKLL